MSLKKIAEKTGTSISTVSRVLNSNTHNCHDPELADAIWQAAKELNYTPNTSARNLRKGVQSNKKLTVDILLTRFDSLDKDDFFKELLDYTKEELLNNNCILGDTLTHTDILSLENNISYPGKVPYKTLENLSKEQNDNKALFLPSKSDTGLIIFGKCSENFLPLLRKRYKYLVGIDRNPTDFAYDEIVCNGISAAQKAVEYLISLGHRNIAYIGDCTFESRYIGYYQTLLSHKIPLSYSNVIQTNQTTAEGYRVMEEILSRDEKPSAFFCANDCTALGALAALKAHKKRGYIPSVISIDDINASQKTSPMLTTIHIPKQEMAHLAVATLIDRMHKKHSEHIRVELSCRLIERESCSHYY